MICLGQDFDIVCEARGVLSNRNERLSCLCTAQQDLSGNVFDVSSPGISEFIYVTQPHLLLGSSTSSFVVRGQRGLTGFDGNCFSFSVCISVHESPCNYQR